MELTSGVLENTPEHEFSISEEVPYFPVLRLGFPIASQKLISSQL